MWVLRTKFRSFAKAESAELSLQPVHLLYTKLITQAHRKRQNRNHVLKANKYITSGWNKYLRQEEKPQDSKTIRQELGEEPTASLNNLSPHLPQAVVGCARLTGQRLWGKHLATVVEKADPGEAPEQ